MHIKSSMTPGHFTNRNRNIADFHKHFTNSVTVMYTLKPKLEKACQTGAPWYRGVNVDVQQ